MVEKLAEEKFYPEGREIQRGRGTTYIETEFFILHTFWLEPKQAPGSSGQLSRWFEWNLLVRTYTQVVPFGVDDVQVYPVEIKVPPCGIDQPKCVMTVHHTGAMMFIEERKNVGDTASGWPQTVTYLADAEIDWEQERDGLAFESLAQNVLWKLYIKDTTSKRKFILQSLFYGYDFKAPNVKVYNRATDYNDADTLPQPVTWDVASRSMRF